MCRRLKRSGVNLSAYIFTEKVSEEEEEERKEEQQEEEDGTREIRLG